MPQKYSRRLFLPRTPEPTGGVLKPFNGKNGIPLVRSCHRSRPALPPLLARPAVGKAQNSIDNVILQVRQTREEIDYRITKPHRN
jgi:hypothetical protein